MTQEEFSYWADRDLEKLRDLLEEEARKVGVEIEDRYLIMAGELMLAGWTPEFEVQMQCMSWYWRRPKRVPWSRGKLFRSTDQAWNAYQQE
jgi:hypothetical protein